MRLQQLRAGRCAWQLEVYDCSLSRNEVHASSSLDLIDLSAITRTVLVVISCGHLEPGSSLHDLGALTLMYTATYEFENSQCKLQSLQNFLAVDSQIALLQQF